MAVETVDERRRPAGPTPPPAPAASNTQAAPPLDVTADVSAHRWWIMLGLIMAAALEILDTTVVNVALPQMSGNLGATTDEIAWVSTGYILANVIVLPMTAWHSGRFGRKRYLMASILIFNIARFMCGLSGSLGEIVFWRIIQGAGGAALLSTAQSTIVEIFPRSQIATVQAIFGLGLIVTPTLGPLLGGYITDNYSWRTIFFIHVPLAIASLALVGLFLQDSRHQKRVNTVDVLGILMLAAGMGSLQYVLEEGERYDWFERPDDPASDHPRRRFSHRLCLVGAVAAQPSADFGPARAERPRAGRFRRAGLGAGLRPIRRHVHLPAVRAEHLGLYADRNRSRAAAGRDYDRDCRDFLRAGAAKRL